MGQAVDQGGDVVLVLVSRGQADDLPVEIDRGFRTHSTENSKYGFSVFHQDETGCSIKKSSNQRYGLMQLFRLLPVK
jgi:hypothetical protein